MAVIDVDPTAGLRPAAQTASLRTYLSELWQRQEYIRHVAVSTLRAQRITTVLGNLWHVLNPALTIFISYLIFGILLRTNRGVDNFVAFLTVGIFSFTYSQRVTMVGARSIIGHIPLIKSFAFPRAMLPVTAAATELISYMPSVAMMLLTAFVTGEPLRLSMLALLLIIPLQTVFNLGAAFIAARATFHLHDVDQILPFAFRLLFYGSGVLFLVDSYVHSRWRWMFLGNPMYCFVSLNQWAILDTPLESSVVVSAAVWSVVLFVGGFWWFRSGEGEFGRG